MTSYEKLLLKFIENPQTLKFKDIEKIILKNWYEKTEWKWSHTVYKKDWELPIIVAIHNNDCKNPYKKSIKKILFNNLEIWNKKQDKKKNEKKNEKS